jgi:hypothetical protein
MNDANSRRIDPRAVTKTMIEVEIGCKNDSMFCDDHALGIDRCATRKQSNSEM